MANEYHDLLGRLERGQEHPTDDAHFHETVSSAMVFLDLTAHDMARKFGCSVSVIRRWLKGENAPHPSMRPPVYTYLINVLTTGKKR